MEFKDIFIDAKSLVYYLWLKHDITHTSNLEDYDLIYDAFLYSLGLEHMAYHPLTNKQTYKIVDEKKWILTKIKHGF
jgi:hypothetical protein